MIRILGIIKSLRVSKTLKKDIYKFYGIIYIGKEANSMSDKTNSRRLTALDENRSLSSIDNTAILNFMNSQTSSTTIVNMSTNTNNSSNKNSK